MPLWQWLALDGVAPSLPVPHFNVLNGGTHARPAETGCPSALDLAASELRQADGRYLVAGDLLDSAALTDRLAAITEQYHRH